MNPEIRLHTLEQLDNLSLSGKVLQNTLSSLKLINSIFGNHRQLSKAVLKYCKAQPNNKHIHIVDLGCGGGDCIYKISSKLKKHNINVTFTGIDGNPNSIAYASQNNPDPKHINFITKNILSNDFMIPQCDLIISSHFMYHFTNQGLHIFLDKLKSEKIKHVIFSELRRSKIPYYLFRISSFTLPISEIAKKDGLIAIQRAFTDDELKNIIQKSNISKYEIIKKPWFRMIVKIAA
ncbi:methyltransferase domain-containing protein [Aquimarina sp. MMG016]|uniref:methyltransferase domain-containing protein n=1 Tax=Aquimarina sp. MMG016 TaxID=2822690 RepID=UPI001B3A317D|nr:methyltransferase domain-containing protein [Aquimarina sp. MMG016]MBQ4818543.1 methyltransferase domain-containing protein [Aquimarina sp. MMG016]